jgi:hypothetical protein
VNRLDRICPLLAAFSWPSQNLESYIQNQHCVPAGTLLAPHEATDGLILPDGEGGHTNGAFLFNQPDSGPMFLQEHFFSFIKPPIKPAKKSCSNSFECVPAGTLDAFCTQIHLIHSNSSLLLKCFADYAAQ